jgi:6-pyruvoyltetrahydropterin/6-carboxytetrahydropterin synthase
MPTYRVCKAFEVESGHMLSKHPGRCRFPHGHSRRIEIVLAAESLDESDMVCDFKAIKLAIGAHLDAYDHAMAINAADPAGAALAAQPGARVLVYEGEDPTTEVMARRIYEMLSAELAAGRSYRDRDGHEYRLRSGVRVERVRVGETSTSWAEYGV